MTRDEVLKLAKEAGLPSGWSSEINYFAFLIETRARADERERCAKLAENFDAITKLKSAESIRKSGRSDKRNVDTPE